jgi:hypothetical protein
MQGEVFSAKSVVVHLFASVRKKDTYVNSVVGRVYATNREKNQAQVV